MPVSIHDVVTGCVSRIFSSFYEDQTAYLTADQLVDGQAAFTQLSYPTVPVSLPCVLDAWQQTQKRTLAEDGQHVPRLVAVPERSWIAGPSGLELCSSC